jgi:uncharacterized protein YdaU (DUF1376 family)
MSQSNPYYQRFPRDEFADTIHLTCEEYGLFQRLRDYSWHHEGIPDTEDSFKRLAKIFQLSKYKFEKTWRALENLFTLSEGFFFYERDESKRLRVVDISAKRRQSGLLGAERRWSTRHETASNGVETASLDDGKRMANAISDATLDGMANAAHHHQNPESSEVEVPPPPPTPAESGGGGASPPGSLSDQQLGKPVSDHEAYNQRCEELGMPAMGKGLAKKLRAKFPRQWSQADISAALVRFPGQTHPGMWEAMELNQILTEGKRQATERKPAASSAQAAQEERDARAMEMAFGQRRKEAK